MHNRQTRQLNRRKHLASLEHRIVLGGDSLVLLSRDQNGVIHLTPLEHCGQAMPQRRFKP